MQRGRYLYEQLYGERRVLGELAAKHGCSLILDPIASGHEKYRPAAVKIRLETLRSFLMNEKSCSDLRVIVRRSLTPAEGGYRQTLFTWHAPTVLDRIKEFDSYFNSSSDELSRQEAAAIIECEIAWRGAV
jgi:hypothetical protein